MTKIIEFTVDIEEIERIDRYLATVLEDCTRSGVQKLCEEQMVFLNGKTCNKNAKVKMGDRIVVHLTEPTVLDVVPQQLPIEIVYQDEDIVVVNKHKGMVVHPALGNFDGTLVNALMYHCDNLSGINGIIRPGIVHRIDKDTSGLLVVAKNDAAHLSLSEQIKAHTVNRIYHGVVYGNVKEENATISAPIGRNTDDRKKMAVTNKHSREAVTQFEVLERLKGFTYMKFKLETGRTHQIRVHMAYALHPLAGDVVYGPKKVIKSLGGQCLHAKSLGFIHPKTGEYIEFNSELPEYFTAFLDANR